MVTLSKTTITAVLLLWLSCDVNGLGPADGPDAKIVGGQMAAEKQFPYMASLQYGKSHTCGGTVYDERNIITAAHCCDSHDDGDYRVQVGLIDLSDEGEHVQTVGVDWRRIHPDYVADADPPQYHDDVCIVHLKDDLRLDGEYAAPAPLAEDGVATRGTGCVVAGWGYLYEGAGEVSDDLMFLEMDIIDDSYCRAHYFQYYESEEMVCAGYKDGGQDSCSGDSGGGLVCDGALTGIVSYGYGCAREGYPGVYTEVAYYADWIIENGSSRSAVSVVLLTIVFSLLLW